VAAEALVGAIRTAWSGGRYLSPQLTESLLGQVSGAQLREPHEQLSRRELEVLLRIAAGRTVGEIATETGLSVKTVSTYRARMLEKLHLRTNAEATRYALDRRLTDD
jgi:two-component system invasion response regulator UvrY